MRKMLLAGLCLLGCNAVAASAADGEWTPDAVLIAQIETKFQPTMIDGSLTDIGNHAVHAFESLDHYARYYAGETVDGERVVVGALVLFDAPAGVHVITMQQLPDIAGGGCGVIHIWYHVETQKIESVCNFPR